MWFAPEIHHLRRDFYDDCSLRFRTSRARFNLPIGFAGFLENWAEMEKDEFSEFHRIMKEETGSSLLSLIMKDDVDGFRAFLVNQAVDTLSPDPFTGIELMQYQPPIIHVCAYLGSIKCFKYLVLDGVETNSTDQSDRSLIDYAIAGGNTEIIRILETGGGDISKGIMASALFHRRDIFQWLAESRAIERYPGVLHAAAEGNNIFAIKICLEHGIAPEIRDVDGSTALHYCAKNDSLEGALMLLKKSEDMANCKGHEYPIHIAAAANAVNVGKLLLESENPGLIDSNETAAGVTLFFILLQFTVPQNMAIWSF
jgi:hypothetical protein